MKKTKSRKTAKRLAIKKERLAALAEKRSKNTHVKNNKKKKK